MISADRARLEGLRLAVELFALRDTPVLWTPLPEMVTETAGRFTAWLLAPPARLVLRPAPYTFPQRAPGPGTPTKTTGAHHMSVTMTDAQQVSYSVLPEDSKGVQVSDTLTWSSDDSGAVLTLTPSGDTLSCVFAAVAPGAATISVTDGTLSASDLITVTPGGVAMLVITPGTPVDEPAA